AGARLEDLDVVPNGDKVDSRLSGPRREQGLPGQLVYSPPGVAAGDMRPRDADQPIRGDSQGPRVKQGMIQRAQRQCVGYLVRPVLAVPAHMRSVGPDRNALQ